VTPARFLAVDLGASSGRVVEGTWDGKGLALREVHRFKNGPVQAGARLTTDADGLWRSVREGFRAAGGAPAAIGVDTWGVDFGLLDSRDRLLGPPAHYRDARTNGMMPKVFERVPKGEVFRTTGIQFMQINTLYQLFSMVESGDARLREASTLLLTPDLFHYWMTGEKIAEYTIASTTQMLHATERRWADGLLAALGIPVRLLPPLVPPGTPIGPLLVGVAEEAGWSGEVPVIAVGSHDTASAVAAIPELDGASAYLSSGTWSLMGVEVEEPVINDLSLVLNFTNEGGVGRTIRLLKNIMGLWLVQECQRQWRHDWPALERLAASAPPFRSLVDPDSPEFLSPGDMPAAIRGFCRRTGQPEPGDEGAIVRCCLESLALKYRIVFEDLERLTGRRLDVIRIVGGGCRNRLLNRFTADACGRPVVAGPVEATALGNILVQAVATGHLRNLADGRRVVAASTERETTQPGESAPWNAVNSRFRDLGFGRG